nr:PREDICTED: ras association domain-containing protein 2 [Apteryx mantelli mantelli]
MDFGSREYLVPCGKDKYISKNELLLHLKTYNIYYEGQNLQLRHREEEGELVVEGLLNISWGLRRPIRLQMQDDNQRIRPPPSSSSWHSGCNLGAHGSMLKPSALPDIRVTDTEAPASGAGETRRDAPRRDAGVVSWGSRRPVGSRRWKRGFCEDQLKYRVSRLPAVPRARRQPPRRPSRRVLLPPPRKRPRSPSEKIRNLHVPSKVLKTGTSRAHSKPWRSAAVRKPRINPAAGSGSRRLARLAEKQKLRATDYPLIARVLQGPCEQVAKVFLMEKDQVEEVTYDVAQYIKFEMPVLRSFIQKLQEEEDREVKKLMRK